MIHSLIVQLVHSEYTFIVMDRVQLHTTREGGVGELIYWSIERKRNSKKYSSFLKGNLPRMWLKSSGHAHKTASCLFLSSSSNDSP